MTYPLQRELPPIIDANDMKWCKQKDHGFWVGRDNDSKDWLVKLSGSFYAYRDHISSFLMQDLGLQTQSSSYITLEKDSPLLIDKPDSERCQLAIMMLDEHAHDGTCYTESACPLTEINDRFKEASNNIQFLKDINVGHMIDWVKLEILACLCGANEPSGYIITKTHQLYVIDNEQMFSTEPSDPITCSNWFGHQTYDSAMEITLELCNQLSHIREKDIQEYSTLPEGYEVDDIWDIKQLIRKSVSYAEQFIERNA